MFGHDIIVIVASAGGVEALPKLIESSYKAINVDPMAELATT